MKKLLSILLFAVTSFMSFSNTDLYAYEAKEILEDQIQTERLLLDRTSLKDDIDILAKYLLDKDVTRYLAFGIQDGFNTIDQAKNFLNVGEVPNSKEFCTYSIKLKENNLPIGQVDFVLYNDATSEMGYWLGKEFQKQGYASEACLDLALKFFDADDVKKFHIEYFPENTASANLSSKIMKNIQEKSAYNTIKKQVKNTKHNSLKDVLEKSDKKASATQEASNNSNNRILYGILIFIAGVGLIVVVVVIIKKKKK